jgi:hypothetical protein
MFQAVLEVTPSNEPPAPVPCSATVSGPISRPRRIEGDLLDRILGRCGRVADTPDPRRYAMLFAAARELFGRRMRWGMMVAVNLFLEGVVYHPVYREKRIPQMAPLALFKRNRDLWTARTVLFVRPEGTNGDTSEAEIVSLYADFEVEALILRPERIDSGYLDTPDFRCRLNRAVYAPCAVPPQPQPTPPRPFSVAVA